MIFLEDGDCRRSDVVTDRGRADVGGGLVVEIHDLLVGTQGRRPGGVGLMGDVEFLHLFFPPSG